MNRKEILETYTIEKNVIQDPGKFEGEVLYAPYFHEHCDDGEVLSYMEDGCGEYVSLIEIELLDRQEFPEIPEDWKYVLITESDNGFVGCVGVTSEENADKLRAEYEREEVEDDYS